AGLRRRRRQVSHPDSVIQTRRERPTGQLTRLLAVAKNPVMRPRRRTLPNHSKWNQPSRRTGFFFPGKFLAADKIWFGQVNEKAKPGFERIVLRRKVGAVKRETHFQAKGVARAQP